MKYVCVFFITCALLLTSCTKKEDLSNQTAAEQVQKSVSIAVFVPGNISGSPVYEMLVSGAEAAAAKFNASHQETPVTLDIIEAGTNQAEWGGKLTALTAEGKYDLILSANPALPEIIEPLTAQFPKQRYIILDALMEGNSSIATFRYNQREEAYLAGYMAALVTGSSMEFANEQKRIGFVAAQEYPVMNNILLPSFIEGAKAAEPQAEVDFRIVGNWYDASKGAELARAMYNAGADVLLSISGGANQGVISTAKELGFYITWFDDNGFSKAPGYVVSSSVIRQDRLAEKVLTDFLGGDMQFGTANTFGMAEGYVDLITDDPLYIDTVPEDIRVKMAALAEDIRSGKLSLPSPTL
ncbi:MAG: BMP family ABC transporter substrate-binding protein [Spirochaetaceae bacterium]|jgi:simple sugar transport system substrate-binding protein|nr:BMP family ABC transporter substrate-binding protein [Spirochaetaceae bacterium]